MLCIVLCRAMDSAQVLRGLLDSATLAALDQGPTYGYAMVQRLRAAGLTDVAEPSVYGTLRRLFRSGLLTAEIRESDAGPPRKVYALNQLGRQELESSRQAWIELRAAMDGLMNQQEVAE